MTRTARAYIHAYMRTRVNVGHHMYTPGPGLLQLSTPPELRWQHWFEGPTGRDAQRKSNSACAAGARARSRRCTCVRCVRAGHVATQLRRDVYERNAYAYGMNKQEGVCVRVRTEIAHGHVPRARILTLQLQS